MIFDGLSVALATPFSDDGELDLDGFRRLTRRVATSGGDVLVVLGSTGEAATLNAGERDLVIKAGLAEARGKPVVVGCGSSSTAEAARMCARAAELGAQGVLVVTPPYNKPMPKGVVRHFEVCAEAAAGLPVMAYNVPSRTGQNLAPDTLRTLWKIPQVVAIKEASANLVQIVEIARTLPAGKALLAGDDALALSTIAVGGSGLVSVLGNVLPAETARLVALARAGDVEGARREQLRLVPVIDALFCESNPIPVKAALKILGIAGDALRLPLTRPEPATHERVRAALAPFLETKDAAGNHGR